MLLRSILFTLLALNSFSYAESITTLATPRGSHISYASIEKPDATANVILFTGGKGKLFLPDPMSPDQYWKGTKNFLIRTRFDLSKNNFNTFSIDAPFDHQTKDGMYFGFRHSHDHVSDVDEVIKDIQEKYDLPTWIIGTSRGTESVANIAINSSQPLAGVIFTASMTNRNKKGWDLTDFSLRSIKIPSLFVHHENDACKVTRPDRIEGISRKLTNSPSVKVVMVDGGMTKGNPCKPFSHHGFNGIENHVVEVISNFIRSH